MNTDNIDPPPGLVLAVTETPPNEGDEDPQPGRLTVCFEILNKAADADRLEWWEETEENVKKAHTTFLPTPKTLLFPGDEQPRKFSYERMVATGERGR